MCISYGGLYQFPPLSSSAASILLRVSCIFVADGAKTELQREDLLEVEPLVCRVRVMVLRVVFLPSFQEQVIISTASFSMRGMYP